MKRNVVRVGLRAGGRLGLFRELLAKKPVRGLVCSTLPGPLWIKLKDLNVGGVPRIPGPVESLGGRVQSSGGGRFWRRSRRGAP